MVFGAALGYSILRYHITGEVAWTHFPLFILNKTVAHMVVFGLKGWLAPQKWPWGLPPISMLAVTAAAVPLVAKLWQSFTPQNAS